MIDVLNDEEAQMSRILEQIRPQITAETAKVDLLQAAGMDDLLTKFMVGMYITRMFPEARNSREFITFATSLNKLGMAGWHLPNPPPEALLFERVRSFYNKHNVRPKTGVYDAYHKGVSE